MRQTLGRTRTRPALGAVALVGLLLGLGGCVRLLRGDADMEQPTTVYVAERVRTLDPEAPLAQALAVRGGRVLAVGSREEVLAKAGPRAEVVELPGATLVPGLQDAHGHLAGLGASLVTVDLTPATSEADAVARLKAAPDTSYQGDWLVGRGWDQNDWPQKAFPTRAALDEAFPLTPVALSRVDGHALWVNGQALKRANITRHTKDPEGGRIVRDAQGEPTGVLVDNAMELIAAVRPQPTDAQLQARLTAALERCARAGLTGVHDAGMDLRTFRLLQAWDMVGRLPLRVYALADGQGPDADTFRELGLFQGRHLTLKGVKLVLDGALGSRGAALHAPYADAPHETGLLLLSPEAFEQRVRGFMEAGFQVAVHAIGDRANTLVLDTLARVQEETGTRALRHRVEHAQVLRREDIPRLVEAGLVASMQPTHATSDMPWAGDRLGRERLAGAYAWESVRSAGARLALGSDFPIERPEVLAGLYAARTRQDAAGSPAEGWLPQERLSGEEALRGFTTGAAWASHAEGRRGRLAPGMDADFVALSVDPVEGEPRELLSAKVLRTVVAGTTVWAEE